MKEVFKNLYQFTEYIEQIQLTIHQYLFLGEHPFLVGTGRVQHTKEILPKIKKILGEKKLSYLLVSHMESDECGGISVLKEEYPDLTVISSEMTAREMDGFGYKGKIISKRGGETLKEKCYELQFIDYPSEVHLRNGIVFFEKQNRIFFSSDLMLRRGDGRGKVMQGCWQEEIEKIQRDRVCDKDLLYQLKEDLKQFVPQFIAVGHGFCLQV